MEPIEIANYCKGCMNIAKNEDEYPCSSCSIGSCWESSNADKLNAYPIEIIIPVTFVLGLIIGFIGGFAVAFFL